MRPPNVVRSLTAILQHFDHRRQCGGLGESSGPDRDAEAECFVALRSFLDRKKGGCYARSSHPNVGGPLPGLTTSSQMEPDALDRLCHSVDGMDKRTERVAL